MLGGKPRTGEVKICKCCEKEFYVPRYRVETAKFCSLECQNKLQYERRVFKCLHCGVEFSDSPSRKDRKYCSEECRTHVHAIESENRRKLKSQQKIKRDGTSLDRFRKHILRIRGSVCECCGLEEASCCMDMHHLDGNPDHNSEDNLVILCAICHRKLHANILNDNRFPHIPRRRKAKVDLQTVDNSLATT